jgi:transcription initiation factor TFIIB
VEPEVYVNRYCTELGLRPEVEGKVKELIKGGRARDLVDGRSPTGVAAAAVYIAAKLEGQPRTQREIADISGVTEVTIRNRYKEFCAAMDIELE